MFKTQTEFFSEPLWPLWDATTPKHTNLDNTLHLNQKQIIKQEENSCPSIKCKLEGQSSQASMMSEDSQKSLNSLNGQPFLDKLMKWHQMQEEILLNQPIHQECQVKIEYLSQHQQSQSSWSANTITIKTKIATQYLPGKYNILSQEVKQFLVKESYQTSTALVAKKYGVSINNLNRWRKSCGRKRGAGRKVNDMELENRLIQWLRKQMQTNPIILTRRIIQERARLWSEDLSFKASKGWLERFAARNRELGLIEFFGLKLSKAKEQK